jgi:L-ascorbate metabolism protein UlaG (beta-lactamase superfamily)
MSPRPAPGEDPAVAAAERLIWIGHATVALEVGGARLLTDPVLRDHVAHLRRHGPTPDPATTADPDAVLISHLHRDHLDLPSLRGLGRAVALYVPVGAAAYLERLGFTRVHELGVGEEAAVGGAVVRAVAATHDGRRSPGHRGPAAEAIGFEVRGAASVYFAGDTDVFPGMAELAGRIDVALLPVWGWGPTLGPGHMDPAAAARAAALVRPRTAVPIHWGTLFPRGLARLRPAALVEPPKAFARLVAEHAPGVTVRVLGPGDALVLDTVARR